MKHYRYLLTLLISMPFLLVAQDDSEESDVEEVVVVGSQIKGASITGALPVTVLSADDIEITGSLDGDELVENLVEQGLNFFNEQEQTSGGVNAARGDSGAYNLRSMGVGNTLTLLNGRRLVMNAGYQTEYIGGDFVPTMTANTNGIPVLGLDRLEILKDGASAIYGADAVAGVVNNVIQTDFEGLTISTRTTGHDNFDAVDTDLNVKYGVFLNDGKTNVSVFASVRDREQIRACEDDRWCDGNYERFLPAGSPFLGKGLDNTYSAPWYQLDFSMSNRPWAASKDDEAEMGIVGIHPECDLTTGVPGVAHTGFGTCIYDTDGGSSRTSPQQLRDYRGALKRHNLFIFINHEFDNGTELFTEISSYESKSRRSTMQGSFKSAIIKNIPADYYWFTQLPASMNYSNTKDVAIDAGRPYNKGRYIVNKKHDFRYVLGFRGEFNNGWNWETAVVNSKAVMHDLARDRFSYQNFYNEFESDLVTTDQVFNIFDPNWETNNGDRLFADVRRDDRSTLKMFDAKFSTSELTQLPAGPVAMLLGFEIRKETYLDNRDDLLDGTIRNSDFASVSSTRDHPFSAVAVGSSPTGDVEGEKTVRSFFVELQVPVTEKIDTQIAVRHENFTDSKSTTVGKFAVGYDVADWIMMRASTSTSFRTPNIIQVNQKEVARTGTRTDALMQIANYYEKNQTDVATATNSAFISDYSIPNTLRYATGASGLLPEESTNSSVGFVMNPIIPLGSGIVIDSLTITYDYWTVEKENTIGLFGRGNQSVYDVLVRKQLGVGGATTLAQLETFCVANANSLDAQTGKYYVPGSNVYRDAYWGSSDQTDAHSQAFLDAGVCPGGEQDVVKDEYLNLATREIKGQDISVYYDFETDLGEFRVTVQNSETTEFYQTPIARFNAVQSAINNGTLPAFFKVEGYGDILAIDTTGPKDKQTVKVNYRNGNWGASLSALRIGEAYDLGVVSTAGDPWKIEAMTTANLSVYRKFDLYGKDARVKLMIKNIADERAPLADGYLGFKSDFHRDIGRHYYVDFKVDF